MTDTMNATTLKANELASALGYLGIPAARKSTAIVSPQIPITEALALWGDGDALNLRRGGLLLRLRDVPSTLDVRLISDITKQVKTFGKTSDVTLDAREHVTTSRKRKVCEDAVYEPKRSDFDYDDEAYALAWEKFEEEAYEEVENVRPDLEITSGKRSFTLNGFKPDDYPEYPEALEGEAVGIYDAADLLKAIERVKPYIGPADGRPALNGVCFELGADSTLVVATDSFRLIRHEMPGLADNAAFKDGLIVYAGDLAILAKLLKKAVGSVELVKVEHGVVFAGATETFDFELACRTCDAHFPEWRRLMPHEDNLKFAEVSRKTLAEAIKAAEVMSGSRVPQLPVKLMFAEDGVNVSLESEETGTFAEEVEGTTETGAGGIALNPKFALEALEAYDSDTIRIGIQPNGELKSYESGQDIRFSLKPAMIGPDVLLMPQRVSAQ